MLDSIDCSVNLHAGIRNRTVVMIADRSKRITIACLLCWLSVTLTLCSQDVVSEQQQDVQDEPIEYGLPDHTEPVSYELRVRPTIDPVNGTYTFNGSVEVVISVVRYTTVVVLNSKDLIVTSVSDFEDVRTGRHPVSVEEFECDKLREWLVIKLTRSLLPTRHYRFIVQFTGTLRSDFTGFHKYFYDSANRSRYYGLCSLSFIN